AQGTLTLFDAKLIEQKCKYIRLLRDRLAQCSADPMARAAASTEQNRPLGSACLQARRHLARVCWIHARIVVSGDKQDGRVLCAVNHMMVRRIRIKWLTAQSTRPS